MNDIEMPYVRQVLCNDRSILDRPDKIYLKKLYRMFPDLRIHGFGRIYEGTWYLILETKSFPYHVDAFGARGMMVATNLINHLPKVEGVK